MMLTSLALAAVLSAAAPAPVANTAAGPNVRWSAPKSYVVGQPFKVRVEVEAPEGGTVVSSWMVSPAAFNVDGKALAKREDKGTLEMPAGFQVVGELDLAPYLDAKGDFKLSYANELSDEKAVDVAVYEQAPAGLSFMQMEPAELERYLVLMQTNQGDMLARFWPDVAPNHVRNFLDLAYIKFYDGLIFHRVVPNFVIQGGDPTGTGSGGGPRTLEAEFSDRKHVPGVLSMARTEDPNSATSQFFVVHGQASHLDNKYSAFGELVWGMDTVDRIAKAPLGPGNRPREPQTIERAIVVLAPAAKGGK